MDYVLLYNNVGLRVVNFERTVLFKIARTTLSFGTPYGTPASIRTNLIFLETRIIDLLFAADSLGLSSFKFCWWAP